MLLDEPHGNKMSEADVRSSYDVREAIDTAARTAGRAQRRKSCVRRLAAIVECSEDAII
jgi:hypothetical protein